MIILISAGELPIIRPGQRKCPLRGGVNLWQVKNVVFECDCVDLW